MMRKADIKPGRYRHYKHRPQEDEYRVIGVAIHESTREKLVVYQALYGNQQLYVRPKSEFAARVEWKGKQVSRFTYISK